MLVFVTGWRAYPLYYGIVCFDFVCGCCGVWGCFVVWCRAKETSLNLVFHRNCHLLFIRDRNHDFISRPHSAPSSCLRVHPKIAIHISGGRCSPRLRSRTAVSMTCTTHRRRGGEHSRCVCRDQYRSASARFRVAAVLSTTPSVHSTHAPTKWPPRLPTNDGAITY